jgi:glutathione S-transferase
MNQIKLTYFDIDGGRAEPTRIALSIAGIPFEDHRIAFAEFREMRGGTPLSALPVVDIDGTVYTQCNAMNRYFGRLAGLYPADPWQAFLCDEVLDIIEDAFHALSPTLRLEGDDLKAARGALVDGPYTRVLKTLGARLESAGGEYFADGRLTVADIKVFLWVRRLKSGGIDHVPADLPDRVAPRLVEHMERIAAEPGVAAYYAKRAR